ncbi:MAG TPA: hypothetical protein QKA08_04310 [Candidatus Megaira endosymbiont of Nemacystus decipiens]|nr:hypothetical protein [Candidatus Megaera endosymbiont of Nemacystus decipiens]
MKSNSINFPLVRCNSIPNHNQALRSEENQEIANLMMKMIKSNLPDKISVNSPSFEAEGIIQINQQYDNPALYRDEFDLKINRKDFIKLLEYCHNHSEEYNNLVNDTKLPIRFNPRHFGETTKKEIKQKKINTIQSEEESCVKWVRAVKDNCPINIEEDTSDIEWPSNTNYTSDNEIFLMD